ncbi:Cytochrome c1 heme lyase [Mortierella sp. AD011]|nr:Cytochrome c1 heme lyase [Mortierella sp. AD010]KAF9399357.1 Cytochrome c1 heme lyase [Mortierella sp. AD011]
MAESHKSGAEDAPKCPVDHSTFKHFLPKDAVPPGHPALPEGHPAVPTTTTDGEPAKCPVSPEAHKHFMPRSAQQKSPPSPMTEGEANGASGLKIDPTNNMPSKPDQFRTASQRSELKKEREASTIPKAANSPDPYGDDKKGASSSSTFGAHAPDPDSDQEKVWIYPSEQMFFNAMKRKNWEAREEDMKFVVPIHNMVNEMTWKHILRWEKLATNTCGGPKLVKFEGKPKEITPKAWLRSWMGYTLPFDRHDWVVDRCGKQVTYIIDFYSGQPDPRYPEAPSFYLDVRPKLTMDGAWLRFKKFMFD